MGGTKTRVRVHYNMNSSIMDDDLLSSSDESSSDDADIMNDVTQPHASEAKDDKEDEKTDLSTHRLTDSSPHLAPSCFLLWNMAAKEDVMSGGCANRKLHICF